MCGKRSLLVPQKVVQHPRIEKRGLLGGDRKKGRNSSRFCLVAKVLFAVCCDPNINLEVRPGEKEGNAACCI